MQNVRLVPSRRIPPPVAATVMPRFAAEERDANVDPAVMPEPAGEQVVDYLAVSEKWKEEKVRLMRVQGREE